MYETTVPVEMVLPAGTEIRANGLVFRLAETASLVVIDIESDSQRERLREMDLSEMV